MNKQRKDSSLKGPPDEQIKDQAQKPKNLVRTRHDYPPLTYGPHRLHYQYSAVLPTIHLTLVSILQGLAFGVLLLGIPISDPHQIYWVNFLLSDYFYFPYLASSILILLIWKEFAQACVYSNWPLSAFQSGLIYSIAVPEILAFRAISIAAGDNPKLTPTMLSGWLIGLGFVGIIGGWIRINNNRLDELTDYVSEEIARDSFKREGLEGLLYIGLGVFWALIGVVYKLFIIFKVLINVPQINSIMSWSIVVLILIVVSTVFWLDTKNRKEYLAKFIENSDLIMSRKEVIRYSPNIEEEPSDTQLLIREVKELRTLIQTVAEQAEAQQNAIRVSSHESMNGNNPKTGHRRNFIDRIITAFGLRNKQK